MSGRFFHSRHSQTTAAYMTAYHSPMSTRRTTIIADADLLDRLDRFARRTRTTKTAVITAALEAWLGANADATELPFLAVGRSPNGRLSLDARSIVRREAGRRPTELRPKPR
jgi:hypothetical protein